MMEKHAIKYLYPGHYFGRNVETKQRVDDMVAISKVCCWQGERRSRWEECDGRNLTISAYGVRINYSEKNVR